MTWGIKCQKCFGLRVRKGKTWCREGVSVRAVIQQEECEKWEGEEWEGEPWKEMAAAIKRAAEED